jgi:hypothetical protein
VLGESVRRLLFRGNIASELGGTRIHLYNQYCLSSFRELMTIIKWYIL